MNKKLLRNRIVVGSCAAVLVSLIVASVLSLQTSATSVSDLLKKTLLNALRTCYSSAYMTDGPVRGSEFRALGIEMIMTDAGKTDQVILVPTQVGNTVTNAQVTCQEVFNGASGKKRGSMSGLLSLYGKNTDNITYFGFEKDEDIVEGNKQGCIAIKYGDSGNKVHTTDKICFKLNQDDKVSATSYGDVIVEDNGTANDSELVRLYYDSSTGALALSIPAATNAWNPQSIAYVTNNTEWSSVVSQAENTLKNGEEWCRGDGGFCRPIDDAWNYDKDYNPKSLGYSYKGVEQEVTGGEVYEQYVKRGEDAASLRGLRYIAGPSAHWNNDIVKFTKDEAYDLYNEYFERFKANQDVFVDDDCYSKDEKDKATANSGYAVYNGSGKWCGVRISTTADKSAKYNVVNSEFNGLVGVNIETILEKMTEWEFSYTEDPENPPKPGVTPTPEEGNDSNSGSSDLAECFNNASSLGWILCPVLQFVGVAADGLWSEIADKWLVVDADQYAANNSGSYTGWTYFRNMANIAFAIFLLIILFSQLTGLGINNYGIKKMLPTLIVMAILVNFSYFICQFLIDVSNIVGYSIEGILGGIQGQIGSSSSIGTGDVFRGALGTLFSAAGIAGVGITAAVMIKLEGPAILVPLLITVLGVLIGIVFAFIVLAVRQAGILLLVIISPLAIICYTLPNTKSLFDKWKKLFTSLLFVYPICTACIAGGQLLSSIMLKDANTSFIYNLVAILLQIVPVFFVPSLVRSSLAAANNIGNRVAQFGNNLRGRATGAARNSEALRRLQTESQFRAAQRNQGWLNRLSQRGGLAGAIGKYGARRSAAQTAAYMKMQLEDEHAKHLLRGDPARNVQNAIASQLRADEQKDVDNDVAAMINDPSSLASMVGNSNFNINEMKDVGDAFDAAMAAYEANPEDYSAKIRARALAQFMMSKGDTGQTEFVERFRKHIDPTGAGGATASAAMQSLGEYVMNNDKWSGSIKSGDTGAFRFMNDIAAGHQTQSATDYAIAAASKFSQSTIGAASDSWYNSMRDALSSNSFSRDAATRAALDKYADMATKALTDPRTASSIKGERLKTLNEIRSQAYELHKQDWKASTGKTDADYEKEFGAFQEIEHPGDELKIIHQKAAVPAGWTESGMWIGGGSGPTKQQQIAYDEWAKHSAEVDRQNSQP